MGEESSRNKHKIGVAAKVLALLVTTAIFFIAAYLFFVPQQTIVVGETPGSQEGEPRLERILYSRYEPAIGYLVASVFLFTGLISKRLMLLAWLGLILLAIWSAVFLFSSGAAFLPITGVLLLLLVLNRRWYAHP